MTILSHGLRRESGTMNGESGTMKNDAGIAKNSEINAGCRKIDRLSLQDKALV